MLFQKLWRCQKMSENNVFNLRDVLKIGIQIGVETALEQMHKQRMENIKCRYDRRLRNTRLLLENYHNFADFCDNAVYDKSKLRFIDVLEDIESIMDDRDEVVLESIKRTKQRSYIMFEHINKMVDMYKVFTEKSKKLEECRKYKIIFYSYISSPIYTNEEIAKKLHIDTRTVRRDRALAIEQLNVFLWGVNGIRI